MWLWVHGYSPAVATCDRQGALPNKSGNEEHDGRYDRRCDDPSRTPLC